MVFLHQRQSQRLTLYLESWLNISGRIKLCSTFEEKQIKSRAEAAAGLRDEKAKMHLILLHAIPSTGMEK